MHHEDVKQPSTVTVPICNFLSQKGRRVKKGRRSSDTESRRNQTRSRLWFQKGPKLSYSLNLEEVTRLVREEL
jgi:hypothetical protein